MEPWQRFAWALLLLSNMTLNWQQDIRQQDSSSRQGHPPSGTAQGLLENRSITIRLVPGICRQHPLSFSQHTARENDAAPKTDLCQIFMTKPQQ